MGQPLILGRYRLLEVRGKGAFGTVEVVYDTRIQRRAAIKRIPLGDALTANGCDTGYVSDFPELASEGPSADFLDIYDDTDSEDGPSQTPHSPSNLKPSQAPGLAEARTAAMLSNPNIVQVYDFETDDRYAYLIMEYVDGPTLAELAAREDGCLTSDELAWVLECVSSALAFAHENGVLHLDIKPENILIDHSGNVKVADFGIAQLATATGFGSATGGTIGYMPPEQIDGDELDERTDEWALASMLYKLTCDDNPFTAKDPSTSLRRILNAKVVPPSAYRNEFDPEVDRILFTALCPDREGRFDSVEEFAGELSGYLGDPKAGKREIVDLIADDEERDDDTATVRSTLDVWAQLADSKAGLRICHILCAVLCAWTCWFGVNLGSFPASIDWTCIGCVAFAGLLAPQLGSILALSALAAGAIFSGAYVTGGAFLAMVLLWWVVEGRLGMLRATFPLLVQPLSACCLGPLYPLLSGFFLSPLRATVTSAFGALLLIPLAAITGMPTVLSCGFLASSTAVLDLDAACLALVTSPITWLVLCGWVFTAFIMSLLCSRGDKLFAMVGEIVGCLIIFAAIMLSGLVTGKNVSDMLPLAPGLSVGFTFIVMLAITALGSPVRVEDRFKEE